MDGSRFWLCLVVPHSLATELCCSFSSGEPDRGLYSEHNEDREDWSERVFDSLQHKAATA